MNGNRDQTLKFGIFDHMDDSGLRLDRQYADRLEIAAACDRAGFRGYHIAEHHGTPHGIAPSPNLFLAALAQRTRRLRLGPMVMLLNMYHPLRAFEEICMLDQISRGRLDLGMGRGAGTIESGFFGVPAEQAQDRYREAADIVLRAMEVDTLSYQGRFFTLDNVPITLSPFQRPRPPLWYGVVRPETAASAAAQAMNIACVGHVSAVRKMTDAYRSGWVARSPAESKMPLLGMLRHIVVADTDAEARALAAPAYARWFETLTHLSRSRGGPGGLGAPASFSEAAAEGHCLAGSASTVREALLRQTNEAGVSYLLALLAFGDLPLAASLDTVAAIETEIMPAFAEIRVATAGLVAV